MDFDLIRTLKFLPGIILGLTIHEFSHAFVALKCGDPTSRDMGRITLNPLKHIDLFGFIMLLVAGFGWAKPVEFNEQNLKKPKRDVMKISIAGPLSNALLAMLLSVVYVIIYNSRSGQVSNVVEEVFMYAVYINWGLFAFNLIPIPPLDGSHILFNYFRKYPVLHANLYKYGSYLFFGLILVSIVAKINLLPIWPLMQFLGNGFFAILGFN